MKKAFFDVLYQKYDQTIENEHIADYYDINDFNNISKKRKQHLEVIASLRNID